MPFASDAEMLWANTEAAGVADAMIEASFLAYCAGGDAEGAGLAWGGAGTAFQPPGHSDTYG